MTRSRQKLKILQLQWRQAFSWKLFTYIVFSRVTCSKNIITRKFRIGRAIHKKTVSQARAEKNLKYFSDNIWIMMMTFPFSVARNMQTGEILTLRGLQELCKMLFFINSFSSLQCQTLFFNEIFCFRRRSALSKSRRSASDCLDMSYVKYMLRNEHLPELFSFVKLKLKLRSFISYRFQIHLWAT